MELIVYVALLVGQGFWIYWQGKCLGSRKAYGVSRAHGPFRRF
jgi:hypothetical protein